MSKLLEGAIGDERRLECARNDAALVAAMFPLRNGMRLNRGPAAVVTSHAVDAVIAGIETGAQRVEVFPLLPDVEAMRKAGAL